MPDPVPFDGPQFVIHIRSGNVPVLAGCTRCAVKFFTPSELLKDAIGAGEYLRAKFDEHECESKAKRHRHQRGWGV